MGRILVIGFAADVVGNLGGGERSVDVLEEPELFERRGLAEVARTLPCVDEVLFGDYVETDAYRSVVDGVPADRWSAVIPGLEYAVPAAADLAGARGLPGASPQAGRVFRSKILLRRAADAAGIPSPRWSPVESLSALEVFARTVGGDVVLKPTGRAASVGVQILAAGDDLARAWAHAHDDSVDPLLPHRPLERAFLVEERLDGNEFSVECLTVDGAIVFANVTGKVLWPGRYPVERGHDVPAALPSAERDRLVQAMAALVAATGFRTGVLHGEWIVSGGTPVLVECAARMPGDKIVQLLALAYGFQLGEHLRAVLEGAPMPPTVPASHGAAIRFVAAEPGRVVAVEGVEEVEADPLVQTVLTVPVGHEVRPLRSSFDRSGFVVTKGSTTPEAAAAAERCVGRLRIVTERSHSP